MHIILVTGFTVYSFFTQKTIKIEEPNPCWVIRNSNGAGVVARDNFMLVFSSIEKLRYFVTHESLEDFVPQRFTWENLVETFGGYFSEAIINHTGSKGNFICIPLQKNP